MKRTDPPIIVEVIVSANKVDIWNAITYRDTMIQWYFDNIPEFEPIVGFTTQFPVVSGDRTFTHIWKVTEVNPGSGITYEWTYREYPGKAAVTFNILDSGGSFTMRLTNTILEDFPQDIPEFRRESCKGGWEYFIQGRLKSFLDD
jgi:uncharacterized protein YndB with AHSA1/START domain